MSQLPDASLLLAEMDVGQPASTDQSLLIINSCDQYLSLSISPRFPTIL